MKSRARNGVLGQFPKILRDLAVHILELDMVLLIICCVRSPAGLAGLALLAGLA